MKRLLLGLCLAMLAAGSGGCCCWEGSGWTPFPWPGCGWDPGCGWNGGGCGWGGWSGWPCNRPGGCGDVYWGDWCTGDPHCSTCDGCGNWVGPPSPGGTGVPPEVYGKQGPYGQQVASNSSPRTMRGSSLGRSMPPREYSPQMVRRSNPRQYSTRMAQRSRPSGPNGPSQGEIAGNRGGAPGEYEGAIQYLGTTDRLVKPAEIPPGATTTPPSANVARRGEPTLADPQYDGPRQASRVQRTSQRQYMR